MSGWNTRFGPLYEQVRDLPAGEKKARALRLLKTDPDSPLAGILLIDTLSGASWEPEELSTVLLLAEDAKIKDPVILRQM